MYTRSHGGIDTPRSRNRDSDPCVRRHRNRVRPLPVAARLQGEALRRQRRLSQRRGKEWLQRLPHRRGRRHQRPQRCSQMR